MDRPFHKLYVQPSEAVMLSHRLRIAWATQVCETTIHCYSQYFRKEYLQERVFSFLWAFAQSGDLGTEEAVSMIERLEDMQEKADEEDYTGDSLWPTILLLHELMSESGDDCVQAIDYAALSFANLQLFKQGICSFDPVVPSDYYYSLTDNVYDYSRRIFDCCVKNPGVAIQRNMFANHELNLQVPLLPVGILANKSTTPPAHEQ